MENYIGAASSNHCAFEPQSHMQSFHNEVAVHCSRLNNAQNLMSDGAPLVLSIALSLVKKSVYELNSVFNLVTNILLGLGLWAMQAAQVRVMVGLPLVTLHRDRVNSH